MNQGIMVNLGESNISLKTAVAVLKNAGLVKREKIQKSLLGSKTCQLITDHRRACRGCIFFCIEGQSLDGHSFIPLIEKHQECVLIIEKEEFIPKQEGTSWVLVSSTRAAWSWLEAAACGHPENQLSVFGITGTNGKTSTAWMLNQIFSAAGETALLIGTLGVFWGKQKIADSQHTTPDPSILFKLMAHFLASGGKHVVLEVSSHAIAQKKLTPILN